MPVTRFGATVDAVVSGHPQDAESQSVTGAGRELAWELRKTGFCEGGRKQSLSFTRLTVRRASAVLKFPLYSDFKLNALHFIHQKTSTGSRLCFCTLSRLLFFVSGTNRPFWLVCFAFFIDGHVTLPKRIGPFKCCAIHVHYACITS